MRDPTQHQRSERQAPLSTGRAKTQAHRLALHQYTRKHGKDRKTYANTAVLCVLSILQNPYLVLYPQPHRCYSGNPLD